MTAQAHVSPASDFGRGSWTASLASLFSPSPSFWGLICAVVALDALWLAVSPLDLEWQGIAVAALALAGLFAAGAFWTLVRPEPQLRAMAQASAFLLACTLAVGVLHYLLASLAAPLMDARLAAAERALGFDWSAHVAALNAWPWLAWSIGLAYHTSAPQLALVIIALSAVRRYRRLEAFARLFAATLLISIVISSALPAAGAYAFYVPAPETLLNLITTGGTWHLEALAALRNGSPLTMGLQDLRGLATFPSFHVCLAILTAWALWPVPVLGWLALVLNAAVIVGTLSAGGHYLPDLFAGAALAIVALWVHGRAAAKSG